jgi:hypothetical protein
MRPHALIPVLVLALGCSAFGGRPGVSAARSKKAEVRSVTLHIDLQDGFQNDEVIIRLDGKQVFHKSGVSTDARISRADGFEATSSKPSALVEFELPAKHTKASQSIKASETPNIGIYIRDGKAQIRAQAEVFLYM